MRRFDHLVDEFHLLFVEQQIVTVVVTTGVATLVISEFSFVLFATGFARRFIGVSHLRCTIVIALGPFGTMDFIS